MEARSPSGSWPVSALLLSLAVAGALTSLVLGVAWWLAAHSPPGLDELSRHERQALLEEALAVSPGLYVPAWFEPELGYTLVPERTREAWGTTVAANELGYRSPPAAKPAGVFRVLFLGDSWTFGMGVESEEAFPAQLAGLANREAGHAGRVEAWSLALPGYNLLNELTGLEFFGDRLEPDAVVVCPTPNDVDSTAAVLPNGSLGTSGVTPADFGEPLHLVFRTRFVESYTLRERWRTAFRRMRDAERRLSSLGVPLLVFFTGTWEPAVAHRLMAESELEAPYVVAPPRLTVGRWRNPPPIRHPSPQAHALYARMVYRGLAPLVGWAQGDSAGDGGEAEEVPIHRGGEDPRWQKEATRVARRRAREELPSRFRPGGETDRQVVALMDRRTGLVGRGAMVQLLRSDTSDRLQVTLGKVDSALLYPLDVTLEIPSPSGGTHRSITMTAGDPGPFAFEIPLPGDIPEGAVVDLFVRAERAAALPGSLAPWSLTLLGVEPMPAR